MITTKKLFEIVELNDEDKLKNIISKKKCKFNENLKKNNIIEHAIIYRSKECFDLLLDKNIGIKDTYYYDALNISIKYLSSPIPSNKYYFDKLIQFGVMIDTYIVDRNNNSIFLDILYENLLIREHIIDYNIITYYTCNPIKFSTLFDKYEKTKDNIRILLIHGVKTNNLDFIKSTYAYIENNTLAFYSNDNIKNFNNCILCNAIEPSSMKPVSLDIIKYIMTKPTNWYYRHNMTTLLFTLYYCKDDVFYYFYDLYKNIDTDEINSIKDINIIIYDHMDYCNIRMINLDMIKKLKLVLNLPIQFDKNNIYLMIQTIIEYIVICTKLDNKHLFDFIEYLLDRIKPSQNITLLSNTLQKEFTYKHDRTYDKFTSIITDYYTKYNKSIKYKVKLDNIHNMILYFMSIKKDCDFNEDELKFLKEVENTFECSNTIINNNDYNNSKIRYLPEFSENMKILSKIFKKYNFVIKELENYID